MVNEDFKLLVESLLISLLYDEKTATIELVSDYPLERLQYGSKANSVRGFMRLTFQQVSAVNFRPGLRLIPLLKPDGYTTHDSPPIVFQQAKAKDTVMYFNFGYSYGELTFNCTQISKQTKVAYAVKSSDSDFQYFDISNNKPVEFVCPFD